MILLLSLIVNQSFGTLRLVDVELELHIADSLVDVRGRPGDRGSLAHLGLRALLVLLGVGKRIPDDHRQQKRDGRTDCPLWRHRRLTWGRHRQVGVIRCSGRTGRCSLCRAGQPERTRREQVLDIT